MLVRGVPRGGVPPPAWLRVERRERRKVKRRALSPVAVLLTLYLYLVLPTFQNFKLKLMNTGPVFML